MKKIIAGNWKMNGSGQALRDMYQALDGIKTDNTVIICPPFTLVNVQAFDGVQRPENLSMGAQDVSTHENGAFTGEISAEMIADSGVKYVIVGHSERRQYHGETNEIVAAKAARAIFAGLTPIICVGETLEDFESGKTNEVIEKQVRESTPTDAKDIIVAYEPVWAIGTGKIPSLSDIESVHNHVAKVLETMNLGGTAILYGGSVKGSNASEIMNTSNVGGVLVGGASLKPDDFLPIISAA